MTNSAPRPLHPLEWIALGLATLVMLAILATTLAIPSYVSMYADFGTELPVATRVAAQRWVPSALASIPMIAMSAGLIVRRSILARRLLIGVALASAALAFAALWWALYLPIFSVAGAISA